MESGQAVGILTAEGDGFQQWQNILEGYSCFPNKIAGIGPRRPTDGLQWDNSNIFLLTLPMFSGAPSLSPRSVLPASHLLLWKRRAVMSVTSHSSGKLFNIWLALESNENEFHFGSFFLLQSSNMQRGFFSMVLFGRDIAFPKGRKQNEKNSL